MTHVPEEHQKDSDLCQYPILRWRELARSSRRKIVGDVEVHVAFHGGRYPAMPIVSGRAQSCEDCFGLALDHPHQVAVLLIPPGGNQRGQPGPGLSEGFR